MSAESGLHISLSAETVFSVGDFAVTNAMFTSALVSAFILIFAVIVNRKLSDNNKPTGVQNFVEWIVESLYGLVYGVTGSRTKTARFLPFIASFFLFIVLNNWVSVLPGVGSILVTPKQFGSPTVEIAPEAHASETIQDVDGTQEISHETVTEEAPKEMHENSEEELSEHHAKAIPLIRPGTADLNTTFALAIISIITTQIFGFMHLNLSYLKKFINFSSPIMFFIGILEIISEFSKIISFAFRLFGNLFAGEVLLTVILGLVPVIVPLPFYGLEIFVGFIQALVFSMLSLVFFNMASMSHEDH